MELDNLEEEGELEKEELGDIEADLKTYKNKIH